MKLNAFTLGGFNPSIAALCSPRAQARYKAIGNSIWLVGLLAFFGGIDIASQVTHFWPARVTAGLIWSAIIMRFDYQLILFAKGSNWFLTCLRVLASLLIAVIVCPPVGLMLSEAKVEAALSHQKMAAIVTSDSSHHAQVEAIDFPLRTEQKQLQASQKAVLAEGLSGHGNHFNDKLASYLKDSAQYSINRAGADSTIALLNRQHAEERAVRSQSGFGDYISRIECLFLLAIQHPFIGLVLFSLMGFLIIVEASALIFKAQANRPDEEYNVLERAYQQQTASNKELLMNKLAENEQKEAELNLDNRSRVIRNEQVQELKHDLEDTVVEEFFLRRIATGLAKRGTFTTSQGKIDALLQLLSGGKAHATGDSTTMFLITEPMKKVAAEIAAGCGRKDLPKALFDWVIANVSYHDEHLQTFCRTASAVFNDRRAVCSEMSILLIALCRHLNIECSFAEVSWDMDGREVTHASAAFPISGGYLLADAAYRVWDIKHQVWEIVSDEKLKKLFTHWND